MPSDDLADALIHGAFGHHPQRPRRSPVEQQQTVAFIDTETLGLDPEYHPVWEVAVIVDGEEHTWFQRVGPRAIERAETIALDMTGFAHRYNDDAALDPHESITRFCELTAGRHLVGMCPWFDSERLHRTTRSSSRRTRRSPTHDSLERAGTR